MSYGHVHARVRTRSDASVVVAVAATKSAGVGLFGRRKPQVIMRPRSRCGASSEYKAKLISPSGLPAYNAATRVMTYVYPGNIKER